MSNEYAFPRYANCLHHDESGMTLRDYFAAKAMQVYLAQDKPEDRLSRECYAESAYRMADAMLEARK